MKAVVYNLKREKVGELELSDEVFGADVKEHLLYEIVKAQLASRRAGTKATKERSAVSGSTKNRRRCSAMERTSDCWALLFIRVVSTSVKQATC